MRAEIKAAQEAYAARPYAVSMYTSDFSCTHRFHTLPDAIKYLSDQYARMRRIAAGERYHALYAFRCFLILPAEEGSGLDEVKVRCDEFIGDTINSY